MRNAQNPQNYTHSVKVVFENAQIAKIVHT